ncbi:MAG: hypothetical protein RLZZ319_85, partial [Actinomycetota bacterium]
MRVSRLLFRLGAFAARRAWVVIGGWLAVIGIVAGVAVTAGGTFSTAMTIDGTDAQRTIDTLEQNFPDASRGAGLVVFHKTDGQPFSAADEAAITGALESVHELHGVDDTVDPFETQAKLDRKAEKLRDAPAKLAKGEAKLADGQRKIDNGRDKLDAARVKLNDGIALLVKNQHKLDKGARELRAAKHDAVANKKGLEALIARYESEGGHDADLPGLRDQLAAVNGGLAYIATKEAELAAGQRKIDAGWAKVSAGRQQLSDGERQLSKAQRQLDRGAAKFAEAKAKLAPATTLMDGATNFRVVSADGLTATGTVLFDRPISDTEVADKTAVVDALSAVSSDTIEVEFSQDIVRSVAGLLGPGEIVGLIVAAIVLFVMLGTLVAAGLPVLSAIVGVAISGAASVALAAVVESTTTTPILGVMLGLAVGIDYSLFILNRHRRQLKAGMSVRDSIALANGTSGNSVTFAGLTVIIALV